MYSDLPDDTDPANWQRMVERWRKSTPAEKGRRVGELNAAVRAAALVGIRLRHPDATTEEQRMYLLTLLYGDELVKKAFGWDPTVRGRRSIRSNPIDSRCASGACSTPAARLAAQS